MFARLVSGLAASVLAGCVFDEVRGNFKPYTLTNVSVTRTAGFDRRAYRNDDSVAIVAHADRGSLEPLRDVTCVIREAGYVVEFAPPAVVAIPNFGYKSPVVNGVCTRGSMRRTFTIYPEKIDGPDPFDDSGFVGGVTDILFGSLAPVVRAAMHSRADEVYKYDDNVDVTFPALTPAQ